MPRKERKDKGKRHRASTHGGKMVEQCDFAGRVERTYDTLMDAVEQNEVGATYQGILYCCEGRIRKHSGKVWRWALDTYNDTNILDNLF